MKRAGKKSCKHDLGGYQFKTALLFTVLGTCMQPTLSRAVDSPDFSLLPRLGLPNKTSNQSQFLPPSQLIDVDGDKDLDLILFYNMPDSKKSVFLMQNKGNVFEPAFSQEEFLVNIPTEDEIFVDDINNDGLLDILRTRIVGQVKDPMVILNSPQGLDLDNLGNNELLSLEDLVGTSKASQIRSLIKSDSLFEIKYSDFDDDGDLDFNIVLSDNLGTKNPTFEKFFEIFFENSGKNALAQFTEKPNQIKLNQDSQEKFTQRYGSLFGDNDFYSFQFTKRSQSIKDYLIKPASLLGDDNVDDLVDSSITGDFNGDGLAELSLHIPSDITSDLLKKSSSTTNTFHFSYDYKNHQLLALNANREVSFSETLSSGTTYIGSFNKDKLDDILIHSLFFFRLDNTQTSSDRLFILINQGAGENNHSVNFSKISVKFSDNNGLRLFAESSLDGPSTRRFSNWVDIDSDGDDDFLAVHRGRNELPFFYLLINEGLNNQNELVLSAPIKNPFGLDRLLLDTELLSIFIEMSRPVITGEDLDQDGDIDLFLSTSQSPSISIYLENTGTAKQAFFATLSELPFNIDPLFFPENFVDLDGDGDIDITGGRSSFSDFLLVNNQISSRDDQITHVSVIAYSEPEAGRIIGGFELIGSTPQEITIRGLGASLSAKNINNPLPDPVLTLFKGQQLIASNDNWQDSLIPVELLGTIFTPESPKEAILNLKLEPGSYTVHLTDKQGRAGVGKISIDMRQYFFLSSPRPKSRSFRVQVGNGEDLAVAEFVVTDGPNQVLIKALGPSLVGRGVKNTLADPELILYSGSKIIASNKDWNAMSNADHLENSGQEPTHVREAAILKKLKPGTYTVHLRGQHNSQGISLIEISTLK